MRSLFIVSLAAVAVQIFAGKIAVEDDSYSFETYLKDFGLKFPANEISQRKSLFEAERQRVIQHNKKNLGWKEGLNHLSVYTAKEKKAFFGRNKNMAKSSDKLSTQKTLPADFKMKPVSELPANVDWRDAGIVSAVKDQGHCGSCWAFASTATIESHVAKASGELFDLSVQQMAMCAPNPDHCGGVGGCEGSTAELAFNYVTGSHGLYSEYQWGYTSYYGDAAPCKVPGATKPTATIDGYVQLPGNNYTAVMNALATVGPVAINVDASTWHAYSSGIYNGCDLTSSDVNHVVVAVGYGEEADGTKYFTVRNSWSASWGEAGYIRLLRTDGDDSRCAVDNTPQDGVACDGQTGPVTVCGTCGSIYDTSYPLNARAL